MSFTFLITGASSGFGAAIAIHALEIGHIVVATARSVEQAKKAYPVIEELGGIWLTLDVTSPNTEVIVSEAVKKHHVNVLINNAGYALRGVLEDLSMHQLRDQMEANLFGALACTKGALPHFRERKAGTIVNISSTSGISGNAGYTAYAASKFAMEGWSESLAAEMACFGVRVLVVEPGGFRTNFQAAVTASEGSGDGEFVSEPYRGSPADEAARRISGGHGKQPGDPAKAAQAIVEAVTGSGRGQDVKGCLRLPLGKDAVQRAEAKIRDFQENVEKTKHIAKWAVFDS
ncbi:Oxidoreductase claN [Pseudocercospora fuligena]|uniref:Oxidoreductase claN n=1 Tax=Pseudocercospora fuligena TaxID=685502 RepID=A0A8H6RT93_9PEZI|nr:Oxidoreductase claN [Pseudocercospora fuligena]